MNEYFEDFDFYTDLKIILCLEKMLIEILNCQYILKCVFFISVQCSKNKIVPILKNITFINLNILHKSIELLVVVENIIALNVLHNYKNFIAHQPR